MVEAKLLVRDAHAVRHIEALANVSAAEARRRAGVLLDPERPDAEVQHDGWRLAPVGAETVAAEHGRNLAFAREAAGASGVVLVLERHAAPVALVSTRPVLRGGAEELLAAARRHDLELVLVADDESQAAVVSEIDEVVPGPAALDLLRARQRDGHVVLTVAREPRLLIAADCSLVIPEAENEGWAGHLLAGDDLATAYLIVEACGVARDVSRHSVDVALIGAGASLLVGFGGLVSGTPARAATAVNAAAAMALLSGHRPAAALRTAPAAAHH